MMQRSKLLTELLKEQQCHLLHIDKGIIYTCLRLPALLESPSRALNANRTTEVPLTVRAAPSMSSQDLATTNCDPSSAVK